MLTTYKAYISILRFNLFVYLGMSPQLLLAYSLSQVLVLTEQKPKDQYNCEISDY
jgi:hypothetical protein